MDSSDSDDEYYPLVAKSTEGTLLMSKVKHFLHVCTLLAIVSWVVLILTSLSEYNLSEIFNPWDRYGVIGCGLLYFLRLLVILALPQVLMNFLGLTCFNAFPGNVSLKGSSLLTPLICVRIVTRGDFPQLVRDNVARNMARCSEAGMDNFLIEVVTDKPIGLPNHRRIREVVVPAEYRPRSGAMYKARALQYCLEDGVNVLADNDYIVHLDEETLMTNNSIRGIINFVLDGKYDFGQGLITYANDRVVNWVTTLADSMRVADDMGKLRFQFYVFHKPILSWKGSFIVAKASAERQVSFDHGVNGSIAEDCYFAIKAYMEGFTFNFVDGDMWEKSPFTLSDFIKQRMRWVQGISLVVHAPELKWRYKIFLAFSLYAWMTMPFCISNIILGLMFPIPTPFWLNFMCAFICAVNVYMYIFGVLKSMSVLRLGVFRFGCCLLGAVLVIPVSTLMENIAVIKGVIGGNKKFYIVKKDYNTLSSTV